MRIRHCNGSVITDQYASVVAAVAAGVDLSYADLSYAGLKGAIIYLGNRCVTL